MKTHNKMSRLLILNIFTMILLYLLPDNAGSWTVKGILIACLTIAALLLFFLLSRQKEKEPHARITEIEPVSQMNPGQYLSKGGSVCAGSDTRYQVTFLLQDDTNFILSLSSRQAESLARGMCGSLVHNGSIFAEFIPEEP